MLFAQWTISDCFGFDFFLLFFFMLPYYLDRDDLKNLNSNFKNFNVNFKVAI